MPPAGGENCCCWGSLASGNAWAFLFGAHLIVSAPRGHSFDLLTKLVRDLSYICRIPSAVLCSLGPRACLYCGGGDCTKVWVPGGRNPREPSESAAYHRLYLQRFVVVSTPAAIIRCRRPGASATEMDFWQFWSCAFQCQNASSLGFILRPLGLHTLLCACGTFSLGVQGGMGGGGHEETHTLASSEGHRC